MDKKTVIITVLTTAALALASCVNKTKEPAVADVSVIDETLDEQSDSSLIEVPDTASLPMFVLGNDRGCKLMVYWDQFNKPEKADTTDVWAGGIYTEWFVQDMFRRNRTHYTNLITGDSTVKMTYVDEVLKAPEGYETRIGELNHRVGISSICARYKAAKKGQRISKESCVIVTDSYLHSHRQLAVSSFSDQGENVKPLPAKTIKQLEEHYGLKASRSVLTATIIDRAAKQDTAHADSTIWSWGAVQFEGEYKKARKNPDDPHSFATLALDVLTDGTHIYVNEEIGNQDGWIIEDEGKYIPCSIAAAFMGPQGIELCYKFITAENYTIGLVRPRGDSLNFVKYGSYSFIDEEWPLMNEWGEDLTLMDHLYHADKRSKSEVQLVKWAHGYIDNENEWVWMRDHNDTNGAFFLRRDDKLTLIGVENHNFRPYACQDGKTTYLILQGKVGESSWVREIHIIKNGMETGIFSCLEVDDEMEECSLNGKSLTKEQGQKFLNKIPESEEITTDFHYINQ